MGVSTNCYTVYGVKLPWIDGFSEAFDEHYEALEECTIMDGMSGEYIVIGDILFDSGDGRYGEMSGFAEIELSSVDARKADIIAKYQKALPEFAHHLDGAWRLMTFVHYH